MKNSELSSIVRAIELQKKSLTLTGFWPQSNPSFTYRLKYYLFWFLDLSFSFFLFWELWMNIKNREFKEMSSMISFMSSVISYFVKHFVLDLHKKQFLLIINKLEHPLFNEYPQVCDIYVQRVIRFVRILLRLYVGMIIIVIPLFGLKPFLTETENDTPVRFTGFGLGNMRLVFHVYQVLAFCSACFHCTLMDISTYAIMFIGIAQFEILRDKLLNARKWAGLTNEEIDNGVQNPNLDFDPQLDAKINKHLAECVKHHMEIIEFVSFIERIYSYYFLVQFGISVIGICNTWFQFAFETDLNGSIYLYAFTISLLMQPGMYCIFGNTLKLKSEELHYACYASDWYKSDNKVRKTFILIMERTIQSAVLTAGKLSPLTLGTYVGLLKMSYSYMALMNNLYGK